MNIDSQKIVPFIDCFDVDNDVGVLMPKYEGTLFD
jgi:hypothetical protein